MTWILPTGFVDPDGSWVNEQYAYNDGVISIFNSWDMADFTVTDV